MYCVCMYVGICIGIYALHMRLDTHAYNVYTNTPAYMYIYLHIHIYLYSPDDSNRAKVENHFIDHWFPNMSAL